MALPTPPVYLINLPPEVRENVCKVLSEDRAWEKLVRKLLHMKIHITTIETLERTPFPSDKLIEILMNHNFKDGHLKIATFYKICATLRLYKVMCCIAPYVEEDIIKNVEDVIKQSSGNNFAGKKMVKNSTEAYLHELPEEKKQELCQILNHGAWRHIIAKFEKFGFKHNHIELCEDPPNDPAREVFKLLADRNLKVSHLYAALACMDLPRAMNILQCYVSENLVKSVLPNSNRSEPKNNISKVNTEQHVNEDDPNYGNLTEVYIKRGISYVELEDMTNNWSAENRLGSNAKGNFYRGQMSGKEVAVKRILLQDERQKVLQELRQLEDFAASGPKNVLKMLMLIEGGGDNNPCIIYPFKEKKSLYDHLLNKGFSISNDGPTSGWKEKHIIALGVTNALIYLQERFQQQIVIVKSSDIILDDTMEPLVADVCLPSMLSKNRSKYLAMYLPQQEKQKIKSFCLGTILLELATGNPADRFDKHPEQLKELKEITMDSNISKNFSGVWKGLILSCTKGTYFPRVREVLGEIQQF